MIFHKTKNISLLCFSFIILIECCKDENSTAPNNESQLIGSWKLNSMSWSGVGDSGNYNQNQLDTLCINWDLILFSDYSAEQRTNLSGPLETQYGVWATSGSILTLQLKVTENGDIGSIDYNYSVIKNSLTLDLAIGVVLTNYSAEFIKQ